MTTFDFILNRAKELGHVSMGSGIQTGDLSMEARKEWEKECERQKQEEDIIERYCYDIRGIKARYEYGFEEYLHLQAEHQHHLSNETEKLFELEQFGYKTTKPEGMTNKQWQDVKRQKKLELKEEKERRESNRELESKSPFHLLLKRIEKIDCNCEAEQMRQNRYCNTCQLLIGINEYLLDRFKYVSMRVKESGKGIGDE